MMTDQLPAVLAAWVVAAAGLALFANATTRRGFIAGHATYIASLLLLSSMALWHDRVHHHQFGTVHAAEIGFAPFLGAPGDPAYHRAGCPLAKREILFRSRDEAEWLKKVPCTTCLSEYAYHKPDDQAE